MRAITNYLRKGFEDNLSADFNKIKDYANWMSVSSKKLQRLLYDEGTSFSQLLDQYRATKVIVLMQTTDLPIKIIAQNLGYSSSEALNAACKRWYKRSPRQLLQQYRNSALMVPLGRNVRRCGMAQITNPNYAECVPAFAT